MQSKVFGFNDMLKKLDKKKVGFLYHKYTKYIVDYKIEGDYLRVFSNIGNSRIIKNTHSNMSKLNKIIVKNKIDIANKIDEYESSSKERLIMLLFNILILCLAGCFIPLTFFIGSYLLFFISIFIFSLSTITTSIIALNSYVLISEIKNLKNITGYKKEMEFKLPKINLKIKQ